MYSEKKKRIHHVALLTVFILFTHEDSFADCEFNDGANPLTPSEVTLPGPGVIVMPADLENDRTVYETTYLARSNNNITCTGTTRIGMIANSALGPAPVSGHTFPIKNSGLALQVFSSGSDLRNAIPVFGEDTKGSGNVWGSYGPQLTFRFIKVGKVKHGTVVGPFKIGTLNYGTLITHNLTLTSSLIISAASCKTSDVSVNMGTYVASEVQNSRGQTNPVKFGIALNDCPEGISRVTYTLQANTPVIDRDKGLVSLDGASSAKGVGLRIMDDNGVPLALDKAHAFNAYDTHGGNFKIPLSAAYVDLNHKELSFGTANTALTFTISYL